MYACAIITARHHVLGKCKHYSAAQRHNGWCVCRLYWTVDPIISWGREREAKAPQERDKGWLTQPKTRGPSWTASASAAAKPPWDSAQQLGNVTEPLQEVAQSSISLIKCGREAVITWRKTLLVIKTVSMTCRGTFPVEIQVAHTSARQNLSLLQRRDTIYSWETHLAIGKKKEWNMLDILCTALAANFSKQWQIQWQLPEMQKGHTHHIQFV